MKPNRRHPGRMRPILLIVAAVIIVVGVAVIVTQRWATLQNAFESEREDSAALAALAAAPVVSAPPAAGELGWPQWRGPNRDGVAPAGAIRTNWTEKLPARLWSVPGGGGYSSFAVVAGRVYTQDLLDGQERVRCLDASSGAEVWTRGVPTRAGELKLGYAGGPRATPTLYEGRVYTVGMTGLMLCLDANAQGQELWRHELMTEFDADLPTWGFASSPLIEGDLVIVQPGGRSGTIAAFHRITGERVWATGKNPNGYSSAVAATLGGIRQIVAVTGDAILGVNPATGVQYWSHPWITEHRGNIASPVIVDANHVFVSSSYNKGCVLLNIATTGNQPTVKEVYFRKNRVMMTHHSTCVARGEFLYGFDGNTLRCVNWRKGAIHEPWDTDGHNLAKGSVIRTGDHLVGLTQDGKVFLASTQTDEFRLLGELPRVLSGSECWALPVVVDGRLYLRDAEKVVCYDLRP